MRQILLNNAGAVIARMPRPSLEEGTVLVKVRYSMISVGTELAGLRKVKLDALAEKASQTSELNQASVENIPAPTHPKIVYAKTALSYLGKAIRDPQKAIARLKQIARKQTTQVLTIVQENLPTAMGETIIAPLLETEQDEMGWNVGYSAVGEVIAVGSNVKEFSIGEWVACAGAGKANHADFISVPQNLVCRIPKGCDLKEASSVTIGTIAMQGVRQTDPKLGEVIAVIGLGLIGQITAQLLAANGCQVIGFDLSAERVERAKKLGLKEAYTEAAQFNQQLRHLTKGHGADKTVITAATSSDLVINQAMEITRRKGTVVIVGDVGLNVKRQHFYRKEIELLISSSYGPGRYDPDYEEQGHDYPYAYVRWTLNRNMQAYLALITEKKVSILPLIDKVIPVANAQIAYEDLADISQPQPLGVVLEYTEDTRIFAQAHDSTVVSLKGHRKAREKASQYVLVGAGAFGTSMLVPQMEKLNQYFFLRGLVSRDAVRGGNYVRANNLEILASDLSGVLADENINLLVIATRHSLHAEQVIEALKANKNVFVEKPLAITWEQLDLVEKTYRDIENPPILMVGFNRRFSPAVQLLKSIVAQRKTPLLVQYRLNAGYIPGEHWIQTDEGGGRNIGEACHMYDVFRSLVGVPVQHIDATSINPGNLPYFRSDNFVATLKYEDGSLCTLTYTALGPKQGLPKERVEVFCDGECYFLDDYKSLTRMSDGQVLWSGEVDKGHFNELKNLAEALHGEKELPISFEEMMESTAISLRVEDLIYGRM